MIKQSSLVNKKGKCKFCGKVYLPKRNNQNRLVFNNVFCGSECRNNYFASIPKTKFCANCGVEFKDRKGGKKKYCSQKCYWNMVSKLHKTVFATTGKYKQLLISGKKIDEHRYIMQNHIGRKLKREEIVHHKNGNRSDNRLQNLELLSQAEHIKKHFNRKNNGRK
jgi:hypothetical protein